MAEKKSLDSHVLINYLFSDKWNGKITIVSRSPQKLNSSLAYVQTVESRLFLSAILKRQANIK